MMDGETRLARRDATKTATQKLKLSVEHGDWEAIRAWSAAVQALALAEIADEGLDIDAATIAEAIVRASG